MIASALIYFALLMFCPQAQQVPYMDMGKAGAGFYGDGREAADPVGLPSVRIGVLGPGKTREGLHLRTAVQIALDEANRRGGYPQFIQPEMSVGVPPSAEAQAQAIPYEMVFREDDGPWGVAARQVVSLAYEDKVWAIIGGLDGMNTHVAELVVSKAWVPVITPTATDSSISYANVPWVFRAAPADSRQADALLAYAARRGCRHLVVLSEINREAHAGYLRFSESAARSHAQVDLHLEYNSFAPEEVVPRLSSTQIDAVIVWGRPQPALRLIAALRRAGITAPVLGSADLATTEVAGRWAELGEVVVSSLCDLADTNSEAAAAFASKFKKATGDPPSAIAMYSYDVARLVVSAIERGGLNRARIRDRISETSFAGLTGNISFNMLGGNDSKPVLLQLKRNRWARLE